MKREIETESILCNLFKVKWNDSFLGPNNLRAMVEVKGKKILISRDSYLSFLIRDIWTQNCPPTSLSDVFGNFGSHFWWPHSWYDPMTRYPRYLVIVDPVGTIAPTSDTLGLTTLDLIFHQCLFQTILTPVVHQSDALLFYIATLFAFILTRSTLLVKAYFFSPWTQSLHYSFCMAILGKRISNHSSNPLPPTDRGSILTWA